MLTRLYNLAGKIRNGWYEFTGHAQVLRTKAEFERIRQENLEIISEMKPRDGQMGYMISGPTNFIIFPVSLYKLQKHVASRKSYEQLDQRNIGECSRSFRHNNHMVQMPELRFTEPDSISIMQGCHRIEALGRSMQTEILVFIDAAWHTGMDLQQISSIIHDRFGVPDASVGINKGKDGKGYTYAWIDYEEPHKIPKIYDRYMQGAYYTVGEPAALNNK